MSRALSVHQGKGATDADAKLGALLEACESHAAETFAADGPLCRFDALAERRRAASLADFAADRDSPPAADRDYHWVEAENLAGGEPLWLPFDLVSLDLTRAVPSPFDRASNGVASGATRSEAAVAALHELIERDSVTEWRAGGLLACTASGLRLDSVPFGWLRLWRDRLGSAGVAIRAYCVPSLTGSPVFLCELNDLRKEGAAYRALYGQGCHSLPEIALFRALAEALQGRATYIAGAREDLLPSDYAPAAAGTVTLAFGLPLPPGEPGIGWDDIAPGPADLGALVAALAAAGYKQVALIDLAEPAQLAIVRAFVCGLGSIRRRRRPPP